MSFLQKRRLLTGALFIGAIMFFLGLPVALGQETNDCVVEEEVLKQASLNLDHFYNQYDKAQAETSHWERIDDWIPADETIKLIGNLSVFCEASSLAVSKACDIALEIAQIPYENNRIALDDNLRASIASEHFWEDLIWLAQREESHANILLSECRAGVSPDWLQFAQGDWPESGEVELLTKTTQLANAGRAAFEQNSYFQAAVNYSQALLLQPNSAILYYSRGNVFAADRNYERSLADYNNAINLNPHEPEFFLARGNVYALLEEIDLAVKDYQQYLQLVGEDSALPVILEFLRAHVDYSVTIDANNDTQQWNQVRGNILENEQFNVTGNRNVIAADHPELIVQALQDNPQYEPLSLTGTERQTFLLLDAIQRGPQEFPNTRDIVIADDGDTVVSPGFGDADITLGNGANQVVLLNVRNWVVAPDTQATFYPSDNRLREKAFAIYESDAPILNTREVIIRAGTGNNQLIMQYFVSQLGNLADFDAIRAVMTETGDLEVVIADHPDDLQWIIESFNPAHWEFIFTGDAYDGTVVYMGEEFVEKFVIQDMSEETPIVETSDNETIEESGDEVVSGTDLDIGSDCSAEQITLSGEDYENVQYVNQDTPVTLVMPQAYVTVDLILHPDSCIMMKGAIVAGTATPTDDEFLVYPIYELNVGGETFHLYSAARSLTILEYPPRPIAVPRGSEPEPLPDRPERIDIVPYTDGDFGIYGLP